MSTVIIAAIVAAALFFAGRKLWKDRRSGGCSSCGGNCSSCGCCKAKKPNSPSR